MQKLLVPIGLCLFALVNISSAATATLSAEALEKLNFLVPPPGSLPYQCDGTMDCTITVTMAKKRYKDKHSGQKFKCTATIQSGAGGDIAMNMSVDNYPKKIIWQLHWTGTKHTYYFDPDATTALIFFDDTGKTTEPDAKEFKNRDRKSDIEISIESQYVKGAPSSHKPFPYRLGTNGSGLGPCHMMDPRIINYP